MNEYRFETKSINAFVDQIVRLLGKGYFRCIRVRIPDHKDPRAVVDKVLGLYDVRQPRWRRERRNLKASAAVHLVWFDRMFVLMLSKGRHDAIEADHHKNLLNLNRTALNVFGYSIKRDVRSRKTNIRLTPEVYRKVNAHMATIAVWDSYRKAERLEREFRRLPYQPYAPVFGQLVSIVKKTNVLRKHRGFEAISVERSLRKFRSIQKVFVE